jgi:hypothetical protein
MKAPGSAALLVLIGAIASCKSDGGGKDGIGDAAGEDSAAAQHDLAAPTDVTGPGSPDGPSNTAADVLDPTGGPTLDCPSGTQDYCISVAGTINGKKFEFTCLPMNKDIVSLSSASFALTCHDASQTLSFRVAVPEKGVGTFDLAALETQAMISDFEMLKLTDEQGKAQMNSTSANLATASVRVAAAGDGLRTGTFEGSWRAAAADCHSFTYSCAQGELRGNFRYRRSP